MKERKKILHVASGDLWAGAEVALWTLAREQVRRRIPVSAALMNEGELADRLRASGVRVRVLGEQEKSPFGLLRALRGFVAEEQPALIHTHRRKENLLGALAGALSWPPIPTLRTAHGLDEYRPSGLQLGARAARSLDRWVGRWWQAKVVAVSDQLATELNGRFGRQKVVVVHNGILPPVQGSLHGRESSRGSVLVFAGRFVAVKRLELWLEVASELARRSPGRWRFVLAGDGPQRLMIERRAVELGLAGSAQFPGFIPDCTATLLSADALLLTSRHEGLPMVVLESLALGIPVIAPDVGGLGEIIATADQGELVPRPSAANLAAAVERVTNGRSPAGGSLLPARFTAEAMEEGYREVYLGVLKNRGNQPAW